MDEIAYVDVFDNENKIFTRLFFQHADDASDVTRFINESSDGQHRCVSPGNCSCLDDDVESMFDSKELHLLQSRYGHLTEYVASLGIVAKEDFEEPLKARCHKCHSERKSKNGK